MTDKELDLGDKIRSAMKQSGKSRKEIAREMGISEANIYKLYQSGDTKVSTLIKLAKATDLPLRYFLNIDESQRINELSQQLEKELMKNDVLNGLLRNQHSLTLQLFDLATNMEEVVDSKETLTLMLPEGTKKIPLSRFLKLIYKFSTLVLDKPDQVEEILKLINVLFNIVELRQLILHPPDESFMLPKEFMKFLPDNALISGKINEYIDFSKLWK